MLGGTTLYRAPHSIPGVADPRTHSPDPPLASRGVRKAVIPAAGLGTRFLPATKAQPKEMVPVVDKPAIQYVVEEAVAAGLTDILIVTGRGKRAIEDHFDRSFELEHALEKAGKMEELAQVQAVAAMARIHYVRQGEARGLGHAVSMAADHVGDEPFAVLLGDDIMVDPHVLNGMLAIHADQGSAVVALMEVPRERISAYGCAQVDDAGAEVVKVTGLVEKPRPEEAPSNLAVMGRYLFTSEIFEALDRTPPGRGGEIQLTDAMSRVATESVLLGFPFSHGRFDIGDKLDYLKATVELALGRPEIGPALGRYLAELVSRRELG